MNTKHKVMQISEATTGGVFTHLLQLANYLDKESYEQIFILSTNKNKTLAQYKEFSGNEFKIVDIDSKVSLMSDFKAIKKIRKYIKLYKPNIIHCHSSKAGLVGRLASIFMKNVKVVYTPHAFAIHKHNSKFENIVNSSAERLLAFITDRIVCVSNGEKSIAEKYSICNSNKLSVILNGIENWESNSSISKEEWLQEYGYSGKEKIVGFLGRLAHQKDPLTFLKVCEKFKNDKTIVFVIIGDGPLDGIVHAMAGQNCILIGHHKRPRDIMKYFDIYLMTSLWEGMPYTILEAMHDGIPVIATNISGVNEIIYHKHTGILVEIKEVNEMRKYIQELLYDSNQANRLSMNARNLINEYYTLNKMIKETEKLYSDL